MTQKIKNIFHLLQAVAANVWYGFPSRRVTVIGVTGTDGKTTTTSLIYHILKASGKKVAMVTSVGAYIGDELYDIGFHVTTPSSFAVQKYIKRAADEGNEYVVLETTSHALDQYRVWGVSYTIAVLTNITHEHLDYHGTYEEYVKAKCRLLTAAAICVVNKDDESYGYIQSALKDKQVITYSLSNQSATLTPNIFPVKTTLVGDFNISNALAAAGATQAVGISKEQIQEAIATFTPPPGRQEVVYNKEFMVMIDFAHTPHSFLQILPELKKKAKGRLIHVFGSAGLRDHTKRPLMGKASSQHADVIVLTSEDPRTESVEDINQAIVSGIDKRFTLMDHKRVKSQESGVNKLFIIPDRKEAIQFAISIAKKGDVVLCSGKSHEKSMNYGAGEVPWDEFAVINEALSTH